MKDEQRASFIEIVLFGHNREAYRSFKDQQVQMGFNGSPKGEVDELQAVGRIPFAACFGNILLPPFGLCSLLHPNTHRHKPCCLEPNIAPPGPAQTKFLVLKALNYGPETAAIRNPQPSGKP